MASCVAVLTLLLMQTPPVAQSLDNGVGLTPALGWSTWNRLKLGINETVLLEVADAIVSSGLAAVGYRYVNIDDGWAVSRDAQGIIQPDPVAWPHGMKYVADYVHSKGLLFGIYTSYSGLTCAGRPGSNGYEEIDALTYAAWGVDYLKSDDCYGSTNGTAWQSYARMRDALNRTGRPIYYSICQLLDYAGPFPEMHCQGLTSSAYTVLPWLAAGLWPQDLANAYLIEYCNNQPTFGRTDAPLAGLLSNLDSQQLLTHDNLTGPGAFSDADILESCNGRPVNEDRAEFSAWAMLGSPLILGNDPRDMDAACMSVVGNAEVVAVNQDRPAARARRVLSWPGDFPPSGAPAAAATAATRRAGDAPPTVAGLAMAPCNASDAAQAFSFNSSDALIRAGGGGGGCLTFGGYSEGNVVVAECTGWSQPGLGSQRWRPDAGVGANGSLWVVDNDPFHLNLRGCAFDAAAVQVCSTPRGDCGDCAGSGTWRFDAAGGGSSTIAAAAGGFSHCLAAVPPPPPRVDIQLQAWAKPLASAGGGSSVGAILFLNRSPAPLLANASWAWLGWPAGARAAVRDLWAHADVPGAWPGGYSALVPPHDVLMLRVTLLPPPPLA